MQYQLALDPALGLTPQDFAAAWNASPERRQAARVQVEAGTATQFDPSLGAAAVTLVVIPLLVGMLSSALFALIEEVLADKGVRRKVHYQEITAPDGTRIIAISIEEEED